MLKLLAILGAVAIAAVAWSILQDRTPKLAPGQIRGAWLAAAGKASLESEAGLAAIKKLKDLGVDTLAVFPEVSMPDITKPGFTWGNQDAELRAFLRAVKSLGLSAFVLPRIESPAFFLPPHPWRADIAMANPADWPKFHEDFTKLVRHYGALAREEGAAIFGIGLEYRAAVREHPDAWRAIARAAKEAFGGPITYSANWDDYDQVTWWDAVDVIGVGAYFELLDDKLADDATHEMRAKQELPRPTLSQIVDGWKPIKAALKALSERYSRPVFFTEVGYTTFVDTAYHPWMWQSERAVDPSQQALCYRALFQTFAGEPWWKGACMWRFYTDPGAVEKWNYSPQGHEAEQVMKAAYRR
jgi:Glycoside Hydrolase Family 113